MKPMNEPHRMSVMAGAPRDQRRSHSSCRTEGSSGARLGEPLELVEHQHEAVGTRPALGQLHQQRTPVARVEVGEQRVAEHPRGFAAQLGLLQRSGRRLADVVKAPVLVQELQDQLGLADAPAPVDRHERSALARCCGPQ